MPPQLKRLIPLFVVFIGFFLIVRHFLIPDSFGQYGHYRGNTLEDISSQEQVHSDKETCILCHDDVQAIIENDEHATLSCLICHGPGLEHTEDPNTENILKQGSREFCGLCHQINAARPTDVVTQVDISEHNTGLDCIDCHNPHQVWEGIE
jgi:hypothetical protein